MILNVNTNRNKPGVPAVIWFEFFDSVFERSFDWWCWHEERGNVHRVFNR